MLVQCAAPLSILDMDDYGVNLPSGHLVGTILKAISQCNAFFSGAFWHRSRGLGPVDSGLLAGDVRCFPISS